MVYCNQTMLVCTRPNKTVQQINLEHYLGFPPLGNGNTNEKLKKYKIKKNSPTKKSSCIGEKEIICLFRHILVTVSFIPTLKFSLCFAVLPLT